MTRLALARNWHLATPEQQRVVTDEFRTLLMRTYVNALARYRDELIVFKRLRTAPRGNGVTVRSEVKQPGKERTTLDYEMEKTPAGWKIYNIKVADVCLIFLPVPPFISSKSVLSSIASLWGRKSMIRCFTPGTRSPTACRNRGFEVRDWPGFFVHPATFIHPGTLKIRDLAASGRQ